MGTTVICDIKHVLLNKMHFSGTLALHCSNLKSREVVGHSFSEYSLNKLFVSSSNTGSD